MDGEYIPDDKLEKLTEEGERRCRHDKHCGTSAVSAPLLPLTDKARALEEQLRALGADNLRDTNIAMLVHATALLEFLDNNLGPTDDFPLTLLTDSDETSDALNNHLNNLRNPVELLGSIHT